MVYDCDGGGGKAPLSHRPCDTTHYRHKNDENPWEGTEA